MNQKYRNFIMWSLYAVLFVMVMLLQTVVFGRLRFYGVKLNLIPVVIVCITLFTGHEAGGLFGLAAAFIWYCTGADDGSMSIITLTLAGILAGYLCDAVFPRRFFPALFLSLGAVAFHEALLFFVKFYLEEAPLDLFRWAPMTAVLSVLSCPVIYLLAKAIRKAGGNG